MSHQKVKVELPVKGELISAAKSFRPTLLMNSPWTQSVDEANELEIIESCFSNEISPYFLHNKAWFYFSFSSSHKEKFLSSENSSENLTERDLRRYWTKFNQCEDSYKGFRNMRITLRENAF